MNEFINKITNIINLNLNLGISDNEIKRTVENIEGDFTIILTQIIKKQENTEEIIKKITDLLIKNGIISSFNIINVFLNINLTESFILNTFKSIKPGDINIDKTDKNIVIEYSSPNTNKPLHLGHLRNIFIGYSLVKILKKCKYNVTSVTLVNDRGIHICKSMVAYILFGENKTPESENIKGDHFVGDFYVKFDKKYKEECKDFESNEKVIDTPIMLKAKEMLKKWEDGDPEVINLWKKMNKWVLDGFAETYKTLNINFDKEYFESETFLLGKKIVDFGLNKGIFYKKENNSVWVNLEDVGMENKLLLREDGTSVYITQDLGTIDLRYKEYNFDKMLYVVGDEQIYHFKVLNEIIKKLGFKYSNNIFHISYGMVELPNGKMKSREGTVVDADDLIEEMYVKAKNKTEELNKLKDADNKEREHIYKIIGLNALRFFLLKIHPKKKIVFDPAKSVDFTGDTGPFVMYTYVRISSLLNNNNYNTKEISSEEIELEEVEKQLIFTISEFNNSIIKSAEEYDPSLLVQYLLKLSKDFNRFYEKINIKSIDKTNKYIFCISLICKVKNIIEQIFELLGMNILTKM